MEIDSKKLEDKDTEDGSFITFDRHFSEGNSNEVWFYKVEGGTHTWPGWEMDLKWWKNPLAWYYVNYEMKGNNDIDTSKEVWSFFSRYASEK